MALADFNKALVLTPKDSDTLLNKAGVLLAMGRIRRISVVFIKEKTIEQRRERYIIAASPVEAFLEDAVAEDSVEFDVVTKEKLCQAYIRFCNDHDLAILSKESIGKILKKKDFQEGREPSGKRETVWRGIKLTEKYAIEYMQQTLEV